MAKNQPGLTITQRTTVVAEEYGHPETPTRGGSPPRRSPQPQSPPDLITFSPDSSTCQPPSEEEVISDVANILAGFQATCDEVMENLARAANPCGPPSSEGRSGGSPGGGSPGGGSPGSPGSPQPPGNTGSSQCPANTNLVKPTLEDMLKLIEFGLSEYSPDRLRHINDLQQALLLCMTPIFEASSKFFELNTMIDNGSELIPAMVVTWGNMADYFRQLFEQSVNSQCPIPDLSAINHPSREITQNAYSQLLRNMVIMCQQAERAARLHELLYASLDENVQTILDRLDTTLKNVEYFKTTACTLQQDDHNLLKSFGQNNNNVAMFFTEWMTGGDHLNQPYCPQRSPMPPTPDMSSSSSPSTPRSPQPGPSGMQQMRMRQPNFDDSSPSTGSSSPGTPLEERQERVRRLQGRAQMLEDIVIKYNELQGSILHEVQNIRDQNEVLEQSMAAMQDIPENPEPPTT